jgi:hypothetical protein
MRILSTLGFLGMSFFFLAGFGAKHSSVETKTQIVGSELELQVFVKPNPGMMVTKEGPWSLTLTSAPGLKLDLKEGKFETKEFIESMPGFTIKAPVEADKGKIEYSVKAFVCTNDKKHCYPQMHKGSIDWSKKT